MEECLVGMEGWMAEENGRVGGSFWGEVVWSEEPAWSNYVGESKATWSVWSSGSSCVCWEYGIVEEGILREGVCKTKLQNGSIRESKLVIK